MSGHCLSFFCAEGSKVGINDIGAILQLNIARAPSWRKADANQTLIFITVAAADLSLVCRKPHMIGLAPHFCRLYYDSPRRVAMVYPFRRCRCGIFPPSAPTLPVHGVTMRYTAAVVCVAVFRSASRASRPPTTRRSVWSYPTPFRSSGWRPAAGSACSDVSPRRSDGRTETSSSASR